MCGIIAKDFAFRGDFKTRESDLRFGVGFEIWSQGDFQRNIRKINNEEVFDFKPITVTEFRHTSNKGVI